MAFRRHGQAVIPASPSTVRTPVGIIAIKPIGRRDRDTTDIRKCRKTHTGTQLTRGAKSRSVRVADKRSRTNWFVTIACSASCTRSLDFYGKRRRDSLDAGGDIRLRLIYGRRWKQGLPKTSAVIEEGLAMEELHDSRLTGRSVLQT